MALGNAPTATDIERMAEVLHAQYGWLACHPDPHGHAACREPGRWLVDAARILESYGVGRPDEAIRPWVV